MRVTRSHINRSTVCPIRRRRGNAHRVACIVRSLARSGEAHMRRWRWLHLTYWWAHTHTQRPWRVVGTCGVRCGNGWSIVYEKCPERLSWPHLEIHYTLLSRRCGPAACWRNYRFGRPVSGVDMQAGMWVHNLITSEIACIYSANGTQRNLNCAHRKDLQVLWTFGIDPYKT